MAMLLALGVCLTLVLAHHPKKLFSKTDLLNFIIIMEISILGGKFLQLILNGNFNSDSIATLLTFKQVGNNSSFPTLFITLILLLVYCKIRKIQYLKILDFSFPYAMLALAIQRTFGCFMAGCCYGLPTDLLWGIRFPNNAIAVHPTQLYYGASALSISILLMNYKRRYQEYKTGRITAIGLALLSSTYVCITFFRGDKILTHSENLTLGQQFAFFTFLISIVFLVITRHRPSLINIG